MFLQHCTYGKTIVLLIALAPPLAFSQAQSVETAAAMPAAKTDTADSGAELAQQPDTQNAFAKKFGKAADVQDLGKLRGGAEVVISNDQKLKGTVADNSATNVATGSNNITSGAFANVSGIPIVVQNSGTNVLIQNSTIINLQLH
ncbi:hypothetical protein ACO0LO_02245 [Undibacterium sp. TJN25]|uniref:hypothetical protein n=1 Tax=Undibacterium sp. TJN25 TaxID=3413056 RepID=UPI003BF0A7BA